MAGDATVSVLMRDVLRHWKVAAVIVLGALVGAAIYAERLPNEYEAVTIVSFSPRPQSGAGADIVRVTVPKYVEYVTAAQTVRTVAAQLNEATSDLRGAIDASVAPDSGNLFIRIHLRSPARSARAANAFAARTLSFAAADSLLEAVQVARALPDQTPSGPPRRLYELAGLAIGLLAGAAAAFQLERGRPRVRTSQEIAFVTGFPIVGHVPPTRQLRLAPAEALADPVVGAAVRTLRTNVERVSRDRPVHAVVVTSSEPGEGKSTVASNFAAAVARLDVEVLLIDGDLRRPSIARIFGVSPGPGLREVLRDQASFDQAIRRAPAPGPGLNLLPTAVDQDAGDLLARKFAEVIRQSQGRFDVVVIDAPPILGGDDARTLATMCDGVLFVVASGTSATSVTEASDALGALNVRVLGVVANKVRASRGSTAYGAYA